MEKMTNIEETLSYRFIEEKDLDQYIEVLKEFFGINYYGAQKEFIQWQYKSSVFQKDKDNYSILAAFYNDKIMAIDAYLPWKFFIDGKEYSAVWDIEWLNNSKVKGLGRKLVKNVNDSMDLYCGYGYNSYSKKAYNSMGFSLNDEIERKIAFLDEEKCIELFSNDENDAFIRSNIVKFKESNFFLHKSIDTISDNYWNSLLKNMRVVSYRAPDYLQWRFFEHPYINYKIVSDEKNAENGIAVLRIEQIKNSPYTIARIVDLMPVTGQENRLLDAVISFCNQEKIVFVDFYCISYTIAEIVCPKPFISLKEHKQFDIPMLFQPIEIRERKSINFVLNKNINIPFDFNDMYATKADSDQDVYLNTDYKTVLL